MTDTLLRMLLWATVGLALVWLLRRPARRVFGAGPAFTLWLLPLVLALAPLLPRQLAPAAMLLLPGLTVVPHASVVAVATTHMQWDWPLWLTLVWLAGTALGFAHLAWVYARLRAGARRGNDAWLASVAASAPGLDLRRVRVHAAGPAVLWALPCALILLPEDFAGSFGSAATRELILRHELTHARRGDAWWTLAMEIVSALLWFHPLAWLARSRFCLDQELACDAASLRELPERSTHYARALLDSVAVQPVSALIPWLAEPQLKERIAMITHIPPGALRRRAGFLAVAALLAGGVVLAGGQSAARAAGTAGTASPMVDVTYKNTHLPRYPVAAVKHGEQGLVVLDVSIGADGKVAAVRVDPYGTTAPASLQQAAVAAAHGWKFRAGEKDGKPVAGVVRVPVNFSLAPGDGQGRENTRAPAYPVAAVHAGEHGTVMLKLHADASGHVIDVIVDQAKSTTSSAQLQAAAVSAAQQWKLTPAMRNGKPVAGWVMVPVRFSLNPGHGDGTAGSPHA